jgi:hypothetical protein
MHNNELNTDRILTGPMTQKGPFDLSSFSVGCKSTCTINALAGNTAYSPNCCPGTHNTQATCALDVLE